MIPSLFIPLDAFPTTPNRKIDRRALPRPDGGFASETEHVAPRDDVERVVAAAFAETLGLDDVGVEHDLFELGGHSLHATSLLAKIEATFGVALELRRFFVEPTVAATATLLTSDPTTAPQIERIARVRVRLDSMSPEEVAALLAAKRATREPGSA
jgi:acyl carrier protein